MFDNVEVYLPIHEGTCVSQPINTTFKNTAHSVYLVEATSCNFTKSPSTSVLLHNSRHLSKTTLDFAPSCKSLPASPQKTKPQTQVVAQNNNQKQKLPPLHVVCMNHKSNNKINNNKNKNNTQHNVNTNNPTTPNSATTTSSFFNSSRQSFSSCLSSLSLAGYSNTSSMPNSSTNQMISSEKPQLQRVTSQSNTDVRKSGSVTSLMYKNVPISRITIDKVLTGLESTLEQKATEKQLWNEETVARSSSSYNINLPPFGCSKPKLSPTGSEFSLVSKLCVSELNINRAKAKSCLSLAGNLEGLNF